MKTLEILEYALENYWGTSYGLYFPNLGGQEIVLDNETIAQCLENCYLIEDCTKVTNEEIEDLYNQYYERVDMEALYRAILLGDIDITMIEEQEIKKAT